MNTNLSLLINPFNGCFLKPTTLEGVDGYYQLTLDDSNELEWGNFVRNSFFFGLKKNMFQVEPEIVDRLENEDTITTKMYVDSVRNVVLNASAKVLVEIKPLEDGSYGVFDPSLSDGSDERFFIGMFIPDNNAHIMMPSLRKDFHVRKNFMSIRPKIGINYWYQIESANKDDVPQNSGMVEYVTPTKESFLKMVSDNGFTLSDNTTASFLV